MAQLTDYKFLFESMLTHLKQGIIIVDTSANVVFYNEPVTQIGGIGQKEAIGKNILEIFHNLTPETSTFYRVLRTGKPLVDYVQTYTNFKGDQVTTLTSTLPLIKDDQVIGAFELYRDVATVKQLSDRIVSLQKELFNKASDRKAQDGNKALYTFEDIIYKSDLMHRLIIKAKKAADSSSPILVYGETGTGKELLVQAIHNGNPLRRKKPFIAQNCAALPKTLLEGILFGTTEGSFTGAKDRQGLFEMANGGTLFLDEVNSMDIELQAKLLRALQDGVIRRIGGVKTITVDVRVIASTNIRPAEAVEKKLLRQDLYFRLNVVSLNIPPLRERREDIKPLAQYFISLYNQKMGKNVRGISNEVMNIFLNYSWPGNVRELRSAIESAMNFIEDDIIKEKDLPLNELGYFQSEDAAHIISVQKDALPSLNDAVSSFEKNLIIEAVNKAEGNYSEAARLLKIPRQTLYNKIKKYGISKNE